MCLNYKMEKIYCLFWEFFTNQQKFEEKKIVFFLENVIELKVWSLIIYWFFFIISFLNIWKEYDEIGLLKWTKINKWRIKNELMLFYQLNKELIEWIDEKFHDKYFFDEVLFWKPLLGLFIMFYKTFYLSKNKLRKVKIQTFENVFE